MKKNAFIQSRYLFFILVLSLLSWGAPVWGQKQCQSDCKTPHVSKTQSQWWAGQDIWLEPQDFEENGEVASEPSLVSLAELPLPVAVFKTDSIRDHSFLSTYSGRLQVLNIPPPYQS